MMYPALRPGSDHAHMAPRLFNHLKENNFEHKADLLGRKPATFYRNWVRQEGQGSLKPDFVIAMQKHGFTF